MEGSGSLFFLSRAGIHNCIETLPPHPHFPPNIQDCTDSTSFFIFPPLKQQKSKVGCSTESF